MAGDSILRPGAASCAAGFGVKSVVIIPAKGNSRRFPGKNLAPCLGRPLIGWAIEAGLQSRFFGPGRVFVSTDDGGVARVARQAGARVIERPAALCGDEVWTEPVVVHGVESAERELGPVDVAAWMNLCVPEVTAADVDRAFSWLVDQNLREVVATDGQGKSTSAIRILRREALGQQRLSANFGALRLDYVDIHNPQDLERAEARLRARGVAPNS